MNTVKTVLRYSVATLLVSMAAAQTAQTVPPSTYPHNYSGMPIVDYDTSWQSYFQVNSTSLPNVTSSMTSYAGNIRTDTPGHPNNTLFFWAVEHAGQSGSITAGAGARPNDPWVVWLQGGPGASSFIGFFEENGPIRIQNNLSFENNPWAWSMLADVIWVDNPVGVGFSTADSNGYVTDETRMAQDFVGFLANLVKVFPSLKTRPLYLTGESYGGVYIPYITKALVENSTAPVKLAKFVIGDGLYAADASMIEATAISTIELYPELIDYDQAVYNDFLAEHINCGFNVNLTYPQTIPIPYMSIAPATDPYSFENIPPKMSSYRPSGRRNIAAALARVRRRSVIGKRSHWVPERTLVKRINLTEVDPWYGCNLYDKLLDYVSNNTLPWSAPAAGTQGGPAGINVYDVPDAINPDFLADDTSSIEPFMQDNRTVAALHAPTSFQYAAQITYPFASNYSYGDNSSASVTFFDEIANAVPMTLYSGNDDSLLPHFGTEIAIQNTTFGGIRGFTRKPSTPWYTDDGAFAGIVHQERNVTYVLVKGAGHEVPEFQPQAAFVFVRDFVLGTNTTGSLAPNSTNVVGGENASLSVSGIAGGPIITGSGTTAGTYSWPAATVSAWNAFIATAASGSGSFATPSPSGTATPASMTNPSVATTGSHSATSATPTVSQTSGARRRRLLLWMEI